jgi:electron transfer flavoprotein alpha subunit
MSTIILTAGDARIGALVERADGPVTALVVGDRAAADAVAAVPGLDEVRWIALPEQVPAEAAAGAVAELVAATPPTLVLAPGRPAERILAGAVAARLAVPAFTEVSQIEVVDRADAAGGDTVRVTRSVSGGIARSTEQVTGPVVVIADGGPAGTGGAAPVHAADVAVGSAVTVTATSPAERAAVDLGRAGRIVSAGRGVKAQEDLALVESLARALDAELACSRPLAEGVGWFGHDRYVGVTGQRVAPALYLVVGISGQLQHTVGARESGVVVAINSDPACPYFAEADYCVVGDLYQVVPALTAALGDAS